MLKLFRVRRSVDGCYRVNRIAQLHTAQRICGTAQFDKIVPPRQAFQTRHIGPNDAQKQQMLQVVGCKVIYIFPSKYMPRHGGIVALRNI